MDTVAAALAGITSSGRASDINRSIISTDAFVLFVFKCILGNDILSIFLFSPFLY